MHFFHQLIEVPNRELQDRLGAQANQNSWEYRVERDGDQGNREEG